MDGLEGKAESREQKMAAKGNKWRKKAGKTDWIHDLRYTSFSRNSGAPRKLKNRLTTD
ncbi:MAG: hypothetical protein ACLQSR_04550 [Limisphaerales bacterium]